MEDIVETASTEPFQALGLCIGVFDRVVELYGSGSLELFQLLHQMGVLYMLVGDYDKAEQFLMQALELNECCSIVSLDTAANVMKYMSILYEAKARR